MPKLDISKFQVPPDQEVVADLERVQAPVDKMISEGVKFVDGSEEQDLAVQRYFIEKGYAEKTAGWLVREANTRKAAESRPEP